MKTSNNNQQTTGLQTFFNKRTGEQPGLQAIRGLRREDQGDKRPDRCGERIPHRRPGGAAGRE